MFVTTQAAELRPRFVPEKPAASRLWQGLRSDLLIVKFVEEAPVRLRQGRLVSESSVDLSAANALLTETSSLEVARLFSRPEVVLDRERAEAQIRSGQALADLNNYYAVRLRAPSVQAAESLLDELNALSVIEVAYAEPIPQPALLETEAEPIVLDPLRHGSGPPAREGATPDFTGFQGYLNAAPTGIGATTAWTFPGGRGASVKVIDIELGWNWNHEDMKVPFYREGVEEYGDHGVAVVGEIAAMNNGFGMTGIASDVEIGSHNVLEIPTADVFNLVAAALAPGDIFVIELHCPGPGVSGGGQSGYIALEYWQANFDAIAAATARGVICCQAAGNGEENFDDPIYGGRFDRDVRDSGAIIVGATDGSSTSAAWFTNYGSRVDLSGWGFNVATCGYGDLQGGGQNQWYTSGFSGTSSATPIVTGAVASLQGIYKAASGGTPLPGPTLAQVLKESGTATDAVKHIGPRPNLATAIPLALSGLATIEGVVTENGSGTPLTGADVWILETGTRTESAADGSYTLPITPGSWTVRTRHFGHGTNVTTVATTAGSTSTHDVALNPVALGNVQGEVVTPSGTPVAGAEVVLVGTPLAPVLSAADGTYLLAGVPFGHSGLMTATRSDLTPDIRQVTTFGGTTNVDFRLAPPIDFEASNGSFSVAGGEWEWGIPTFAGGPASAHSPVRCWGTDLEGGYSTADHRLTSPDFDLTAMTDPRLTFWQWYSIWGPYDGAFVEISTNGGGSWQVLHPVGGYPDPCIYTLPGSGGCRPGFTGTSPGWVPSAFDLTGFVNQNVRFRFTLAPFPYTTSPGWYIDDLQVHGANSSVAVPDVGVGARPLLSAAMPNPARQAARFALTLARPADLTATIFDAMGRAVREVRIGHAAAGHHTVVWDGADERGSRAAPGIYFLSLVAREDGASPTVIGSRKVVLAP
jgi:hypothetical protein